MRERERTMTDSACELPLVDNATVKMSNLLFFATLFMKFFCQ